MMRRRGFLQVMAALPALPGGGRAASSSMAGRIARLVFLDDAASLAAHSMAVPAATARAIASNRHLFFAGAALNSPPSGPATALAVRAGRATLEVYTAAEPASPEERLRRDARLLRELAKREGGNAPVSPEQIACLFDTLSRRVLIAIHTYIPDEKDVEGWMERLIRLHEAMEAYWRGLAEAATRAEVVRDDWYDAADPIVRAAAALHHGVLDPAAVAEALALQPRCTYGRLLVEAHARLSNI